jgi:plastocyanin
MSQSITRFRALTLGAFAALALGGALVLDGAVSRAGTTQDAIVEFPGFSYTPNIVTITVGSRVTWQGDLGFHPLAQSTGANDMTPLTGGFRANTGNSFSQTFTQAGTFYYICTSHFGSGMVGEVRVLPAQSVTVTPTNAPPPTVAATSTPNQTVQPTATRSSTAEPTKAPPPTRDPRLDKTLYLPITVR